MSISVSAPDDDATKAAVDSTAGYLTLKEVTLRNVNDEGTLHRRGVVLSPWEVNEYVKMRVAEGSYRYRAMLEPLTNKEVSEQRGKATALEGDRLVDGEMVSAPWNDYVGLHPEEIMDRLRKTSDRALIDRVRQYERAGLKRQVILDYTPPAEREPWLGYEQLNVREVLDKMSLVGPAAVEEIRTYEAAHRKRPAILEYEADAEETPSLTETTEA